MNFDDIRYIRPRKILWSRLALLREEFYLAFFARVFW